MAKRQDKSSFSVTCSLLNKYIKEKGSLADLGLGMPTCVRNSAPLGKPEVDRPMTTMSFLLAGGVSSDDTKGAQSLELFPQSAGLGQAKAEAKEQQEKSQLTIFYGGKVLVFDNFPAEKAKDLMLLASKELHNFSSVTTSVVASSAATTAVDAQNSPAISKPHASLQTHGQPSFSELPIARKASLHRFLEKRKDRINAKAPYQPSKSSGSRDAVTVKEEEISQPWLGLGPHMPHMLKPVLNSDHNR